MFRSISAYYDKNWNLWLKEQKGFLKSINEKFIDHRCSELKYWVFCISYLLYISTLCGFGSLLATFAFFGLISFLRKGTFDYFLDPGLIADISFYGTYLSLASFILLSCLHLPMVTRTIRFRKGEEGLVENG